MSADDHGSYSTYCNWNCRCVPCTGANTAEMQRMKAQRAARLKADPRLATHGRYTTYQNWSCRCDACRKAWTEHARALRQRAAAS